MKTDKKNSFFFFKWGSCALILLFFISINFQFAEENIISVQGKKGSPYIDLRGNLNIVYINSNKGISLATVQKENNMNKISVQDINYAKNIYSVRAKKDKTKKIRLVWEERAPERSDIFLAQLKSKKMINQINLTFDQEGFNFSPCIDFSSQNALWVTWVNYFQKKYTILVKNVTTNQTWKINSSLTSSALSPQIIIDGTEKIWLFWVGPLRNHDEILYTHFDGVKWVEPLSLNQHSDIPHITPSVSLDFNGFPHIVWSAYDGNDYELYYSYWDGNNWIQERKITNNQDTADTSPCISLILDTTPVIAWLQYSKGKRYVSLTYKIGEEWSPEINISSDKSTTVPPRLISSGDRIGISWQEKAEIKTTFIHFYKLQKPFFYENKNVNLPRILALDKNKYIGFGDSITYGFIGNQPAPNKGYIPRLESLINNYIGNSQVINRGVGGEKTSEGLSRINSVINAVKAKTIFLMEGTNDAKATNISIDTAAHNLRKMADRCLDFGMSVFLASIIPKRSGDGITHDRIIALNSKIKSTASQLNIHFVDQFNAFNGRPYLYSDSTHPNESGYQAMAGTWFDALGYSVPSIDIDKTSLSFEGKPGGSNPSPQKFKVRNSEGGKLKYQINADQGWISVSPQSGESTGEWDEIEASVNISNLSQGSHQGTVAVSSDDASNSPQKLTVHLTILGPVIELDRTSLSFERTQGEANPPPQKFKIRNSGAETLNYKISTDQGWISVSIQSGDSKGEWDEIEVSVDISNLSKGNYQGTVTVSSDNAPNSPQKLTVHLTIKSPTIELDKISLSFEGTQGEANPPPQKFKIRNSGAGTLNYKISVDQGWISISPQNGESTGEWDEIEVSVDISNLSQGDHQGTVTIISEKASLIPQNLTVNLTIKLPPLFPPINFRGEKKRNRSFSQIEYINVLNWEVNPQNKIIENYRIYVVDEGNKTLLEELDAQTFEYWHRRVDKDKIYKYELTAGDNYGRESKPVSIEIQ